MTTSAPQWPGQEGTREGREEDTTPAARPEPAHRRPTPTTGDSEPAADHEPHRGRRGATATEARPSARSPLRAVPDPTARQLQPAPVRNWTKSPTGGPTPTLTPDPSGAPIRAWELGPAGELGATRKLEPVRLPAPTGKPNPTGEFQPARALDPAQTPHSSLELDPAGEPNPGAGVADLLERRRRQQRLRRAAARRNRFVVVRDAAERDLWVARRLARMNLPSPVAVTRDIALGLLEVEAGCRSAAQLERIFSPRLWEELEHRIGRRGGPLPSGRSLISVRCQEHKPGLADTVAVVRRGELVRPVALRLDACGGRWTVTELRWWRNETDTAMTPGRDGGTS
jgi:hypothetical protein